MKNETNKLTDMEVSCLLMMRDLGASMKTASTIMGTLACTKNPEIKQKRLFSRLEKLWKEHKSLTDQDFHNILGQILQ